MNTSPFLSNIDPVCPNSLLDKAKSAKTPRVVIARAGSELPMQAAKEATQAGIMEPVFTGEAKEINEIASQLDWDISAFDLFETTGEAEAGLRAATLCGEGRADVIMKGHLHTDVFMKSVLNRDAGLRTGGRLFHIFHMTSPESDEPLLISDAAVNVAPDLATRQASLSAMADMLTALGIDTPKLAILSATESAIPSVPSSMEAKELANWAREALPKAIVEGPLALDLILSAESARIKGFESKVAGVAQGICVPDIVSGNALFKALVYTKAACAAGIVLGAKVPVLLTSRADPPAARLASAALAAIMQA